MARVITFSRRFPKGHPKEGQKTYFVEKIWAGLRHTIGDAELEKWLSPHDGEFWMKHLAYTLSMASGQKKHTIRAGQRLKSGEWVSPRIWSGLPYHSPQIQFAPELKINAAPAVFAERLIKGPAELTIGGMTQNVKQVAANDGLNEFDFRTWFGDHPFDGQCIIWGENPYSNPFAGFKENPKLSI